MTALLRERDLPIWLAAKPWLDVRSNDEHTLVVYALAQALLDMHPDADPNVTLPAVLLHDVGWKMVPQDKLVGAIGPKPIYPEFVRVHEIEGVRIAREILAKVDQPDLDVEAIVAIVDGHDTRKAAHSLNDAIMQDADKLSRFTAQGVAMISGWFALPVVETISMLKVFVTPSLFLPQSRTMALALAAENGAIARFAELTRAGETSK